MNRLAPYALSCFIADAPKGHAAGAVCKLPANAHVDAAAMLAKSGRGAVCTLHQSHLGARP